MRTNGDGEPGGTAGPPILAAIDGAGLKDVAVLVSRYRLGEGAKLGTGGLVRAYGGTAAQTLAAASIMEVNPIVGMVVEYAVADTGAVYSLLGSYAPRPIDDAAESRGSDSGSRDAAPSARLAFDISPDLVESVSEALVLSTGGRAIVQSAAQAAEAAAAEEEAEEQLEQLEQLEQVEEVEETKEASEGDAKAEGAPERANDHKQAAAADAPKRGGGGKKKRDRKQPEGKRAAGGAREATREMSTAAAAPGDALAAPSVAVVAQADDRVAQHEERAPSTSSTDQPRVCAQCAVSTPMLFQDETDRQYYCAVCWKAYYDMLDGS